MKILASLYKGFSRSWSAFYLWFTGFFLHRARYRAVEINLGGAFPERWVPSSPLEWRRRPRMTHRELIEMLDLVAQDPKVQTVILRINFNTIGLARLQEVARTLDRIKAAGKKLVAQIESAGTREFLLAARCEKRTIVPSGIIALTGLNMQLTYLRGLLDKADIKPELLVAGKYKSAAETFMRKEASEAAREMTEGLLDEVYGQVVGDLAETLGKPPARIKKIIDAGPYTPERALKAKLVDTICYRDELLKELKLSGAKAGLLSGGRYQRVMSRRVRARARLVDAPLVALVHIGGTIRDGRGDPGRGQPGASGYVKLLRRITREDAIKAVVLRVSSPGGAATGSDLIRREVQRLTEKKPVVVSMGDVAASGGYMISAPGSKLFAELGTLTGSIGVVGGKFDMTGLLAKFGISRETHQRGAAAGILSPATGFSRLERKRMQEIITSAYRQFKAAVAAGRKLSAKKVNELAEGRVWTGSEAIDAGLVDDAGGVGEALREAALNAGGVEGEPARLVEFPVIPSPLKLLLSMGETRHALPLPAQLIASVEQATELSRGPFAGLPFDIRIE